MTTATTFAPRILPQHVVNCHDCDDVTACDQHLGKNVKCGRCIGTGAFITGTVNGVPTGPGGACFRCNGKGFHTDADRKRNGNYERFGRRY